MKFSARFFFLFTISAASIKAALLLQNTKQWAIFPETGENLVGKHVLTAFVFWLTLKTKQVAISMSNIKQFFIINS